MLLLRMTPAPPDEDEEVLPKLKAALEFETLIPAPVELETDVELVIREPPTLARVMPVAPLVEVIPLMFAAIVPVVRLSA